MSSTLEVDQLRTCSGEKLFPYLDSAQSGMKAPRQSQRLLLLGKIQGDNDAGLIHGIEKSDRLLQRRDGMG